MLAGEGLSRVRSTMVENQVKFNFFSCEKGNFRFQSYGFSVMHFLDFVSVNVYSLSSFNDVLTRRVFLFFLKK